MFSMTSVFLDKNETSVVIQENIGLTNNNKEDIICKKKKVLPIPSKPWYTPF